MTIDISNIKIENVTTRMCNAVNNVLVLRKQRDAIAEVVRKNQLTVLAKHQFKFDQEFNTTQEPILHWTYAYDMSDADFIIYNEEVTELNTAAGILPSKPDNCPLLEAEQIVRDTERTMVEEFESFTNISAEELMYNFVLYKKYIELCIKLIESLP